MSHASSSADPVTAPLGPPRPSELMLIALGGLLLYALNVDFWLYGDSALYADYALRRHFSEVSLHIGYYWLVAGADVIAGRLFGMPIQETMAWLNVAAGTLLLCVAYSLGLALLQNRTAALLTVAVLAFSGRAITNATTSEIYTTQALFVLLSFLLFAQERIAWSGVAAACAMLVSPLSAFAFLFYPVLDWQRSGTIRWNVLFKLGGIALLCYTPFLIGYGHELLWGRRGLLSISGQTPLDVGRAARNFPKYQFKQYTVLLALYLPALLAIRKQLRFFALAAAVALPHLYVISRLPAEDNVFIFNTDFFTAAILALGWLELSRRKYLQWVGPAMLAGHIAILIASDLLFSFNHHRSYDEELRAVNNEYLRGKDATLITDWGTAMPFVLFARDSMSAGLIEEKLFDRVYDLENPAENRAALNAPVFYVLDRWNPTPLNRLFRSEEAIREQYRTYSLRNVAERTLNLQCALLKEETNRLYRCERAVALSAP